MEYIDIDKDLVPYKFDITLDDETYTFHVNYNYLKDFFTIDLYKNDDVIILGEKLVYGKPLFETIKYKDVPKVNIIPFDKSGISERVSFENLSKDVFLYIVGDKDEILD